jgi:hypothetical protein
MRVVSTAAAAETHKMASSHAGGGREAYEASSTTFEDDEDEDDTQAVYAGDRDCDDHITETDSGGSSIECNLEEGRERGCIAESSMKSRRTSPSMSIQVPATLKARTKIAAGTIKGTLSAGKLKEKATAGKPAAPTHPGPRSK